jgi:hypothetical protein
MSRQDQIKAALWLAGKVVDMNAVWTWLQGKKTYLVCASAVLTAVVAHLNGQIDTTAMIGAIFGAVAGSTLRHGLTTDVTKAVADASQQN